MITIIRLFGFLSIAVAIFIFLFSFASAFWLASLLPLAAGTLLGGALLIAFGRVVELLEEMNAKLEPVHTIAVALGAKYRSQEVSYSAPDESFDSKNPIVDPLANLPQGTRIERHFRRRVAFLPDRSVVGETDNGPQRFNSFADWRQFIGE